MTHSYVFVGWGGAVCLESAKCDVTCSYVWLDSLICVTWHIHICDIMIFFPYVCLGGGGAVFLEPVECDGSILGICQIWHDNLIVESRCRGFALYVSTHSSSPYKRSLIGRLFCVYTVTAPRNRQSIWKRRCGELCMLLVLEDPFLQSTNDFISLLSKIWWYIFVVRFDSSLSVPESTLNSQFADRLCLVCRMSLLTD